MKNSTKKLNIITGLMAIAILFVSINSAVASTITKEKVIELVNQSRVEQGLAALSENIALDQAAELKSQDMIANNYFAHTSPAGLSPWHWFEQVKYEYHFAGENLAMNFVSAEKQHTAWMNSPTHRKNILNENYSEIGIAVHQGVIGGHETIIVVQEFGAPFGFVPVEPKVNGDQIVHPAMEVVKSKNLADTNSISPMIILAPMIVLILLVGAGINIAIVRDVIRYRKMGVSTVRM